jgi:hypothetical protein
MGTGSFSLQQLIEAAFIASIPYLILTVVAWIRLGPRMSNMESMGKEREITLKLAMDRYDTQLRIMENCLTRLTALGEVAERRLERLESK